MNIPIPWLMVGLALNALAGAVLYDWAWQQGSRATTNWLTRERGIGPEFVEPDSLTTANNNGAGETRRATQTKGTLP